MRAVAAGSSDTTIVVDIPGVRKASGVLGDVAHGYAMLATRVRQHALPEMPPGVAAWVGSELQAVSAQLGAFAQPTLDLAQELRVRAFWAEIADRLSAGYDLSGARLTEFEAAYASGLLTRYAEPWEADLARAYAKKLHDREHPGGLLGALHDLGDFGSGLWDSVKDPAVMLYHLTPFSSGWTHNWVDLGKGLEYGIEHPIEFGKDLVDLQALHDRGFAYWLGNIAPAALATAVSGGTAAALRGAEATDRVVAGVGAVDRLGEGADAMAASSRLLRSLTGGEHEWTYDVLHPGPLTPGDTSLDELRAAVAQTFASGKYDLVSSRHPYLVFRAGDGPGGRFFTLTPPSSEAEVRIDSAVKAIWTSPEGTYRGASPVEKVYAFVVEHSEHPIPMGPIADQGGVYLGGSDRIQLYIDDRAASGLRQVGEWDINHLPDWLRELKDGSG